MAIEDGMAVDETPADLVTGASLVDGEIYLVQNTGDEDVYFRQSATAPVPDAVEPLFIVPGDDREYLVDAAKPMWLWTKKGRSFVGVEEAF